MLRSPTTTTTTTTTTSTDHPSADAYTLLVICAQISNTHLLPRVPTAFLEGINGRFLPVEASATLWHPGATLSIGKTHPVIP